MPDDGGLRLHALAMPRHSCRHASACCSSYSVGPLLPDDQARVQAVLPAVRRRFPDQALDDPLVARDHQGAPSVFLRKQDGFCCFWLEGTGCTIHSVAGDQAKPLVCQLFPVQLVRAGGELRIGVRPTCLEDHACWQDGPPIDSDLLDRLTADPRSFLSRPEPEGEQVALRLASVPDLDTGSILSFLFGRDRRDVPCVDGWLEVRLRAILAEIDAVGETGPVHPRTATARVLAGFRRWLDTRDSDSAGQWPELPDAGLPWFRDALRRLVFLRQTSLHPGLAWALVAYVAAARWAAAWASDGGWDASRFGHGFSTWLVLMENPRLQRPLVAGGPPIGASGESSGASGGPTVR